MNTAEGGAPIQSLDDYPSFNSDPPPSGQDSSTRFRSPGHYQGPYPNSNHRMRGSHHSTAGDFQQRGRYSYNQRGVHRPYYKNKNVDQQEQSETNGEYQAAATTTNFPNRHFNSFVRPSMWQDPWARMTPRKVPVNGTTLVFDSSATH